MSAKARYSLEPLAVALGCSLAQLGRRLNVSGSTWKQYRDEGVTERVADRLAVKVGKVSYEVWPELLDHAIASVAVPCANCSTPFVPCRRDGRFCSRVCNRRWWAREQVRRVRATEAGREANRLRRRRYYAENAEYERARERRRYAQRRAQEAA